MIYEAIKHKQPHTRRLIWQFIGAVCLQNSEWKLERRSLNFIIYLFNETNNFMDCLEICVTGDKDESAKAMATVTLKLLSERLMNVNINKLKLKQPKEVELEISQFKQLWEKLSNDKRVHARIHQQIPPQQKKRKKGRRGPDPTRIIFTLLMKFSIYVL